MLRDSPHLGRRPATACVWRAGGVLALLPGGDPAEALEAFTENEPRLRHTGRMEARFLLWRPTQDPAHLEEAQRLLRHLVDHAPEEHRGTMIEQVPLHRDIKAAWEELQAAS